MRHVPVRQGGSSLDEGMWNSFPGSRNAGRVPRLSEITCAGLSGSILFPATRRYQGSFKNSSYSFAGEQEPRAGITQEVFLTPIQGFSNDVNHSPPPFPFRSMRLTKRTKQRPKRQTAETMK